MKERVSLSLDAKLVKELDQQVDGHTIRSRSDAVERILKEHVLERRTVVILAGGDPKSLYIQELKTYRPLVDIGGQTLIENIISKCRTAGFSKIVMIGQAPLIAKMYEVIGNGDKLDVNITYVEEAKGLGSAKTLELAKRYLKTDFLFLPCDHYFDFDLKKLFEFHSSQDALSTLGIHARTSFDWKTSVVVLDGYKIVEYEEFPKKPKTHLISVFIGFMKTGVFNYIPPGDVYWSIQENIFPKLAEDQKLFGYPVSGNWVNVHSRADVEKVIKLRRSTK